MILLPGAQAGHEYPIRHERTEPMHMFFRNEAYRMIVRTDQNVFA